MSKAHSESIYKSGQYLERHPKWHSQDSYWKAQQITRILSGNFLAENFRDRELSIVDIGCGAGGVLGNLRQILISEGYKVYRSAGIDLSDDVLGMARENWPNIEFHNCDLSALGEHFDIGLLIDVIEHLNNPARLVRSCALFCDYLIFHIPLDDNCDTKIRKRYQYYLEALGHIQYYSFKTAFDFLESNSLKILDSVFTKRFSCAERATLFSNIAFPLRLVLSLISESLCAKTLGGISLMALTKSLRRSHEGY